MKLQMLVSMVGPRLALEPGDEYVCGDAEAKRLIEAGFAVPVSSRKLEKAVKPKPRETR